MGGFLLVDSPIYIDELRARRDPAESFDEALRAGRLLTCGIIRCEVLRGIVKPIVHEKMRNLFLVIQGCSLDETLWSEAADLAWKLDRRGIVLPLPDLAIAACAFRHGATVVTTDGHFHSVPDLPVLDRIEQ